MSNNQQQGSNPQSGLNPLANPFNGPMGGGPGYGDGPGGMYAPPGNQAMMQPQGYGPQGGGYDGPQGYNSMPPHRHPSYGGGNPHYQNYQGGRQPPAAYNMPPNMAMRGGRHPMGGMPPGMGGPNMGGGGGGYGMHPGGPNMGGGPGMMMDRKPPPPMGNAGGYNPHMQPPPPHMPPPPQQPPQQPPYMMGPPPQSMQPPPMHAQPPMPMHLASPQQQQRMAGPMPLPPPPPLNAAPSNVGMATAAAAYNVRTSAAPAAAVPQAVPSYKKEVTPKVILVTGFRRTGKTTVAKELAKQRQYEYVSLKKTEENEDGEEVVTGTLSARLAPLVQVLQRRHEIKGIVIDDALLNNKFEPYYVHHLLERAGLHFDILVIITTQLSDLLERKVEFRSSREMRAHPESFEFGSRVEETNSTAEGIAIAVVDGNAPLDKVVEDALLRVKEVEMHHLPPLRLPTVTFVPHATLVTDPDLVEEVIAAESTALNLGVYGYDFPYVEPNFLLDYVQFVRHALLFKHYLLTPWIWGDKISLIGYDDEVYIHLPSYQVVFVLDEVPAALENLLHAVAEDGKVGERAAVRPHRAAGADGDEDDTDTTLTGAAGSTVENEEGGAEKQVAFSLEAVMLNGTIYVTDMMLMSGVLGARALLPDRVKRLKETFESLPPDCGIQLLPHYPVNALETCLSAHKDIARGVLFINPDGMEAGNYDSRNFIYASEERKTVQIRIWEGRQEDDLWIFKAYARENEDEVLITNADGVAVPVHIPDEQVVKYGIDDGNIVECILETDATQQQQQKGGGKRSAKGPTSHFTFQRRCEWQVTPTTLYYQSAFSSPPAWQTKLFFEACAAIRYVSVAELT